ncbi:MAG: hypothetical protein F4X51_01210 [Gemmatimonadetes bacterium]|nr:hypothetical protein [Gemmatimonadota bacterium]
MLRDVHRYHTAQALKDTFKTEAGVLNSVYEKVFNRYQHHIDHYFFHLYQVVKFVDQSDQEVEIKKFYIDLIRAQLSSYELCLLFYYGLTDRGANFKDLVEKYPLFAYMPSDVSIDEEHRKLYAPSAYGESG